MSPPLPHPYQATAYLTSARPNETYRSGPRVGYQYRGHAYPGLYLLGHLPTAGVGYELQTIAAVVLGGTNLFGGEGNLAGAVIGVIILTMLTNILDLTGVNPFWDFFAIGLVLWLAVIFRSRMIRRR